MNLFRSTLNILLENNKLSWGYTEKCLNRTQTSFGETDIAGNPQADTGTNLPAFPSERVLVIPRQEILTKTLKFFVAEPAESGKALEQKLSEELPYNLNEVIYAPVSTRATEDHDTEVRIFWILRKTVEEKIARLRSLDCEPDRIFCTSQVLFIRYLDFKKRFPELPETAAILHIGQSESELLNVSGRNLLAARVLKKGAGDFLREAEAWKEEWRGVAENIAKEKLPPPQSVLLAGIPPNQSLEKIVKENTGLPVYWLDGRGNTSAEDPHPAPAFLTGLPHDAILDSPDLSPADYRSAHEAKKNRRIWNQILLATVVLIAMGLAALALHVSSQVVEKKKLSGFSQRLSPDAKRVLQMARQLKLSGEFRKTKQIPLSFLGSLPAMLPPEIWLTQIEYDETSGFQLRGIGNTHESISNLLKAIKKLPYISKAEFDYSNRKKQGEKEYFEFQISVSIT